MHVHVGKKELNTVHVGKICEFMYNPSNLDFIQTVAGRTLNNYCSQTTGIKGLTSIKHNEDGLKINTEGAHSTALNISTKDTIEFRVFSSPKTKQEFLCRLEFVKAIV